MNKRKKITRVRISKFFILLFAFAFLMGIFKLFYVALSSSVDGINLIEIQVRKLYMLLEGIFMMYMVMLLLRMLILIL